MLNLLPKATKLVVKDYAERPAAAQLKAVDHVFLLEPKQRRQRMMEKTPVDAALKHLRSITVNKPSLATSTGSASTPGLTYAEYGPENSTFSRLTLARKLFSALGSVNPKRILVICNDQSENVRNDFAEAVAAAGHAYVCPLVTFKKKTPPAKRLRNLDVYCCSNLDTRRLKAEANGNNLARVLSALPPNILNAANYVDAVKDLAHLNDYEVTIYDQAQLKKMGAEAFLAVARGNSHSSAAIVRLRRSGTEAQPWASLVGKGVCFDTGGINVKGAEGMHGMHEDMQGSAVALGSFVTMTQLLPERTLECWLAITENRIDGDAHTPNEIITAANGTTIEVIHSDAEGRMALCDTLHFASQQNPLFMIDYATLTGACVNAVTDRYSGAFSNHEQLNAVITNAGRSSGERAWPFPMDADFDEMIESKYADVLQCPHSGKGDHIAAARFLSRFVDARIPWVHIDLSCAVKRGGLGHIGTDTIGLGVRLTTHLLIDQQAHSAI